jgi:hypothetical protein
MKRQPILAITSHGNAPYLMAAKLAHELGDQLVVIPHYYGHTQERILEDEIPTGGKSIFLSKELGNLLWPLLFDHQNSHSFTDFSNTISNTQNQAGILQTENRLGQMLADGIPATSLDGTQNIRFAREDFWGAINLAQPLLVNLSQQVFFFTGILSKVYGTLPDGCNDTASIQACELNQPYARLWKRFEDRCPVKFIPRIHACSYHHGLDQSVIPTPPLAVRRAPVTMLSNPGVLFSPSGTQTDTDKLKSVSTQIPADYEKYVLTGRNSQEEFVPAGFRQVSADVYSDPRLEWVISRGGWGTTWECLMNKKPLLVVQTTYQEDPEMGHTQKSLDQLGLAAIWNGAGTGFPDDLERDRIHARMQVEQQEDERVFGPFARNGYAFIAKKIRELSTDFDMVSMETEYDC